MGKKKDQFLTETIVTKAVKELLGQGLSSDQITIPRVRRLVGPSGSNSTIKKYIDKHLGPSRSPAPLPSCRRDTGPVAPKAARSGRVLLLKWPDPKGRSIEEQMLDLPTADEWLAQTANRNARKV